MSDDPYARFERHQLDKQMALDGKSNLDSIDPWERLLKRLETRAGVLEIADENGRRKWKVRSKYILREVIGIPPERFNGPSQGRRLRAVMNKLGWVGPRTITFSNKESDKGYWKTDDESLKPPKQDEALN